jgi:Tol biopolymer transport system component
VSIPSFAGRRKWPLPDKRLVARDDNLDFAFPVWSPDGQQVAFLHRLDLGVTKADLYVTDVDESL